MTERALASIRIVDGIRTIPDADQICAYQIGGWWVVDAINKYSVGDLVVYFEIDSVLPVMEGYEFLRKSSYVKKEWMITKDNPEGHGFRLRTIKLRGQVSQGLITDIPSIWKDKVNVGEDVTDLMGIMKWDPPVPARFAGRIKGLFPTSIIRKTDQERIQNLKESELSPYTTDTFEVTIKLDGASGTIYHNAGVIGACSRNLELDWQNDSGTELAQFIIKQQLQEILPKFGNIAIQGEIMGPGIQGNREKLQRSAFYVFDIWDIDNQKYLNSMQRIELIDKINKFQQQLGIEKHNHLKSVPLHSIGKLDSLNCDDILDLAEGPSINNPVREGLVFKSIDNPDFSFKAISNKFLLKNND